MCYSLFYLYKKLLLPLNLLVSEYGLMDLTEQKTRRSELNIKVSENLLTWLFVVYVLYLHFNSTYVANLGLSFLVPMKKKKLF